MCSETRHVGVLEGPKSMGSGRNESHITSRKTLGCGFSTVHNVETIAPLSGDPSWASGTLLLRAQAGSEAATAIRYTTVRGTPNRRLRCYRIAARICLKGRFVSASHLGIVG